MTPAARARADAAQARAAREAAALLEKEQAAQAALEAREAARLLEEEQAATERQRKKAARLEEAARRKVPNCTARPRCL
jgi:hypothetical protein